MYEMLPLGGSKLSQLPLGFVLQVKGTEHERVACSDSGTASADTVQFIGPGAGFAEPLYIRSRGDGKSKV